MSDEKLGRSLSMGEQTWKAEGAHFQILQHRIPYLIATNTAIAIDFRNRGIIPSEGVLELGFGTGELSRSMIEGELELRRKEGSLGRELSGREEYHREAAAITSGWVGTDVNFGPLEITRKVMPFVAVAQVNSEEMPFSSEQFGHAMDLSALDVVPWNQLGAISLELHRVIKPGGSFTHYQDLEADCTPYLEAAWADGVICFPFFQDGAIHFLRARVPDGFKDKWESNKFNILRRVTNVVKRRPKLKYLLASGDNQQLLVQGIMQMNTDPVKAAISLTMMDFQLFEPMQQSIRDELRALGVNRSAIIRDEVSARDHFLEKLGAALVIAGFVGVNKSFISAEEVVDQSMLLRFQETERLVSAGYNSFDASVGYSHTRRDRKLDPDKVRIRSTILRLTAIKPE
jgi:ubiquinone/menaquinone biosynthesis C-methylase UbiE